MNDASVINISEQYDKIELTIENEADKNSMIDELRTDKPHNGSPITKMEISPNGKYLVTYSEKDYSIVGWNVENIDDNQDANEYLDKVQRIYEGRLELDITVQTMTVDETTKGPEGTIHQIKQICVSDDKKLAYIYIYEGRNHLKIVDMNNRNQKIELSKEIGRENGRELYSNYCTFNLRNQFILYGDVYNNGKIDNLDGYIWIYSTQKRIWTCKKPHEISKDFELFGISKDSNFYLLSNNSIYEWSIRTKKGIFTKYIEGILGENIGEENTEEVIVGSIFVNEKDKVKADDIKVMSNGKFICLKFKDKIIVYSIELEIPIATLDIYNDNQLYNFMNSDLYSLLPTFSSLFDYTTNNGIWNSIMKSCWKESLDRLKKDKEDNQLLTEDTLPSNIQVKECLEKEKDATKYAFGILDGYVWKFKFEEKMEEIKFSNIDEFSKEYNDNEIVESWNIYLGCDELINENNKIIEDKCGNDNEIIEGQKDSDEKNDKMIANEYEDLNLHLFSPYTNTIHELFKTAEYVNDKEIDVKKIDDEEMELTQNKIKWKIKINKKEMELQVFLKNVSDGWDFICTKSTRIENFENIEKDIGSFIGFYYSTIYKTYKNKIFKSLKKKNYDFMIIGSLLFNNNDVIILTTIGLFIFHFNENDKSIFLNYFYFMDLRSPKNREKNLHKYKKEFSKDTLPLPKHDSFELREWTSYVKDNKESFLKYGVELLTFAIKKHDLDLIDEIYEKCMEYFKEDVNNKIFLSIITSTILLYEYYPEYIAKYSLDTDMIIDSPSYSIECQKTLHLYSFSKLSKPIAFNPISMMYSIVVPTKSTPKITFMVPYIKFVNYPQDYNWWKELIMPQPNLFVKTTNCKEIYKTWGGEALINFKWSSYGMNYYFFILYGYSYLLLGFIYVAKLVIPENNKFSTVTTGYFIISIVLGFSFFTIEVRKFIYKVNNQGDFNIKQWIDNIINIVMYSLSVFTIIFLQIGEKNEVLLSFSILFLSFKIFISAAFYSEYYIILINVGKQVFLFLIVFISFTILSFATAFYVLLSPKLPYSLDERTINDDPNNPWNLASTYQAFENQNDTNAKLFTIQTPDENTNMFASFGTAMFATFLLFIGDTSALSNWTYRKNWALAVLMLLFTSFTAIFILNVFIGLFSEAINFDVKTSVLMMKANFLAELEMFYPRFLRKKVRFPEVMCYHADINKIQEKINQMIDDKKWNTDKFPEMKQNLLKILKIENPQDNDALLRELLKKVEKLENTK